MSRAVAPPPPAADAAPLRGPFGHRAIRVARVADIEIGLDWSWLFVFALISTALAARFGMQHEDWSPATRWGAALASSLLFFLSILLHELGHSLTSNRLGLPVRSITLFLFGGLARLSDEPRSPREELLIGAAGPLVSLALGGLFLGLAAALPDAPPWEVAGAVCGWLGLINLILAAFNLFPGHPLDGGHILHAAVWALSGDRGLATRVASTLGTAFALGLMGIGAFGVLFGGLGFLWWILIGWFLFRASQGTAVQAVLKERLGRVPAGEAMASSCPTVSAGTTVAELIEGAILRRGERHFCVEENGELVGLVTLNEVKIVPVDERARTPVSAVMVPRSHLATLSADESLWTALQRMDDLDVNQLPITAGTAGTAGAPGTADAGGPASERLIGVLTREQLLRVVRNQLDLGERAA